MLFIFLSGVTLWLAYGLLNSVPPIIWANGATAALIVIAIGMKFTHPNRRAAIAAEAAKTTAARSAAAVGTPAHRDESFSVAAAQQPNAAAQREPVSARYIEREATVARAGSPAAAPGLAEAAAPRKLRVAVDMDEVIADAFGKMLRAYNERTGRNVTKEQIAREGIGVMFAPEFLTPELKIELDELPHDRSFFGDLELMEGAQEALRALSKDFEIFIASAAMDVPSSFDAKYQWLKQYFPFIPQSHYIFCGDKSILNADFLVDDRPRHFEHFRGTGILFTAPHNVNRPAQLRANNWQDVVRILEAARTAA
jgi:5'(3')-deoxyribonucleotidase